MEKAIRAAKDAIHTVPSGWILSGVLHEFGDIMQDWAIHPNGNDSELIDRLHKLIDSCNKLK